MRLLLRVMLLTSFLLTTSCGDSGGNSGDSNKIDDDNGGNGPSRSGNQASKMPVDWKSVPSKFNPEIHEEEFSVKDLSFIDLRILGISDEVSVKQSDKLSSMGKLKIYRVWQNTASFGRIEIDASFNKLKVRNYTGGLPYSCSKGITNKQLVDVDGGCNLFVELTLPSSSEIEVYSGDSLVSNRYFPMTFDELLDNVDRGFNEDKIEAVDEFLRTYKQTGKKPKLLSLELEQILKEFTSADKYKFSALKKLYISVSDQENLNEVIENSFTFESDREFARRIVGL